LPASIPTVSIVPQDLVRDHSRSAPAAAGLLLWVTIEVCEGCQGIDSLHVSITVD
jgi:hypothetical protein